MDSIFHEKQEGSLCAQHCLNALLQGPYFTPVDLATLAQKMDEEERLRMAESGVDSEEYRKFIEQPSGNMDDSGYFSVQVISSALEVWGLELVPFKSSEPLSKEANAHPENMTAYICNYRDHWFTIRKLGYQWFNLNSLLAKPQLISNTYLSIFLAQLLEEGYSIFIVKGNLPECSANELLKITPAEPVKKQLPVKKANTEELELKKAINLSLGVPLDKDEEELQAALQMSLADESPDPSLDRAIQLSLQLDSADNLCVAGPSNSSGGSIQSSPVTRPAEVIAVDDEDEELKDAIQLSLQPSEPVHQPRIVNIPITVEGRDPPPQRHINPPVSSPGSVDLEEIRRRRLAYIESKAATGR